jgi:aspartate ammonia-lyase
MSATRRERDLLGELELPADALHGIHTARALESFGGLARRPVHRELVHAFGAVKLACARTNQELGAWEAPTFAALEAACVELMEGKLDAHVAVDALQGGAGTSTNMNVNEVLANRALLLLGRRPGDYDVIDPIHDVNRHQSTNDTFPTALRVAAIWLLRKLERELVALVEALQERERAFAHVVKVGRTELQDAVPMTLGRELAAWAEAFGRDRWRVYKCEERLRVVNLGGTSIGTGLGAPRRYIFRVVDQLREITGIGLARAENLVEATQNADALAEVSGIARTCAVNLLKVSGDLRLLSSGPDAGLGELRLPARQAGSSAMPGKVNPVIPEAVSQVAIAVMAGDQAIAQACALGSLELNPFLPLVADELLSGLELLAGACATLARHCVVGLEADEARCRALAGAGTAAVSVLVEAVGYDAAQAVAIEARRTGAPVRDVVARRGLMTAEAFDALLAPERVNRLGSEREDPKP